MCAETRNKIKKYAGVLWPIGATLMFGLVYGICYVIMNLCGVTSELAQNISIGASANSAIAMYIVLAIWGMRKL